SVAATYRSLGPRSVWHDTVAQVAPLCVPARDSDRFHRSMNTQPEGMRATKGGVMFRLERTSWGKKAPGVLAPSGRRRLEVRCEYPLLRLSLVRLPVDDRTIKIIAILIGATLVAGVHVLGLAASRLVQAEGDRIESRRDWFVHRAVVTFGAGFYAVVIAALAF